MISRIDFPDGSEGEESKADFLYPPEIIERTRQVLNTMAHGLIIFDEASQDPVLQDAKLKKRLKYRKSKHTGQDIHKWNEKMPVVCFTLFEMIASFKQAPLKMSAHKKPGGKRLTMRLGAAQKIRGGRTPRHPRRWQGTLE